MKVNLHTAVPSAPNAPQMPESSGQPGAMVFAKFLTRDAAGSLQAPVSQQSEDASGASSIHAVAAGLVTASSAGSAAYPISGPMSQALSRGTVFGFDALGMFGRYGPQPVPDGDALEEKGHLALSGAAGGVGAAAFSQTINSSGPQDILSPSDDIGQTPSVSSALISLNQTQASSADEPVLGEVASAQPPLIFGHSGLSSVVEDMPMSGADNPVNVRASENDASSAAAVNLLVAGGDGALTIVARSSDASENYAHLRRVVEDTAAEFGMQVSEFQLNGSTPQSITSPMGGRNGSRAR